MTQIEDIPTDILPLMLKQARTMSQLTLSETSTQTGISRTTINRHESSHKIQIKTAERLVRHYEKSGIYISKLKNGTISIINTQAAISIITTREVGLAIGSQIQINTTDEQTTITSSNRKREVFGEKVPHPNNSFVPFAPVRSKDRGTIIKIIYHGQLRDAETEINNYLTTIIVARPHLYRESI